MTPPRVLLLAGTTEATAVAAALGEQPPGSVDLTVSFAGRTTSPTAPFGEVRVGGFGGPGGLAAYLVDQRFDVVVDALHPFAAVMPFHVAEACARTGTPRLKVVRPAWEPRPDDTWLTVPSVTAAAGLVAERSPAHVLLTIGRQELDPFRSLTGVDALIRSIEPVDLEGAWAARPLLQRGPFTVEHEVHLFQAQRIDLLVSKNSGGTATAAKLEAARTLSIPVVMVDRPLRPSGQEVATAPEAVAWILAAQPSG